MKGFKVSNKTYQPLQLIINKQVYLLPARGKNNYVIVYNITKQMQTIESKGLITIRKIR